MLRLSEVRLLLEATALASAVLVVSLKLLLLRLSEVRLLLLEAVAL